MLKAVAFDAFGTLVKIFDKRYPYLSVARTSQNVPTISPMAKPIDLEQYAHLCQVTWQQTWDDDLASELDSITTYSETIDVLSAVRAMGLKTAVASNLAQPYGKPIIDQLGTMLDVVCFSFELGTVKPDPKFYEALCHKLDCKPSEILMVGDTWRCDYAGATAAGLQALHLDRRGRANPERQPVSINDLNGVLSFVQSSS